MAQLIPKTLDDYVGALQIYRSPRIGPRSYFKLCHGAKDFDEVRERLRTVIAKNKIKGYHLVERTAIEAEIERGREFGARLICLGDERYPKLLCESENAPPLLWVKGKIEILSKPMLTFVGSRNASIEGVRMTTQLSRHCAALNVAVVSGLARGIDTAAHQGAIAGATIAVLGGGLDVNYPKENANLQESIGERGLIISEMPFGHQPQSSNFPQRNRIIAALSHATLVTEAGIRSGTAITAKDAADLGRDILAVPGHPFHGLSSLPNQLLMDGATMIRNTEDLDRYLAPLLSTQPAYDTSDHVSNGMASPKQTEAVPQSPPVRANHADSTDNLSENLQRIGKALVKNAETDRSNLYLR